MIGVKTRSILRCFYIISCNMQHFLHIPKKGLCTLELILMKINTDRCSQLKTKQYQHKWTIFDLSTSIRKIY